MTTILQSAIIHWNLDACVCFVGVGRFFFLGERQRW